MVRTYPKRSRMRLPPVDAGLKLFWRCWNYAGQKARRQIRPAQGIPAMDRGFCYCAVSVNVTVGCPRPYGPSAITLTKAPELAGSVNVILATPEAFTVAICFVVFP